jgi:hypothetical protein
MLMNLGAIDQTVRIVLGVGLLSAACFVHGSWSLIAIPGAILALTGLIGRCPLYIPFGIRTRRS